MFLEKASDVLDSVFSSIVSTENLMDKRFANNLKQKKITGFFINEINTVLFTMFVHVFYY